VQKLYYLYMYKLSLTPRNLFGLLTALGKRLYYDSDDYDNQTLCETLTCEESEIALVQNLLNMAGTNMWSDEELSRHVDTVLSQEVDLSADHKTVLFKYWGDNREKIAGVLQGRSTFNSKYENLAWRVDMKIASNKYSNINEPTAFFELSTSSKSNQMTTSHLFDVLDAGSDRIYEKGSEKICFEMNQGELKDMILELGKVHKALQTKIG